MIENKTNSCLLQQLEEKMSKYLEIYERYSDLQRNLAINRSDDTYKE